MAAFTNEFRIKCLFVFVFVYMESYLFCSVERSLPAPYRSFGGLDSDLLSWPDFYESRSVYPAGLTLAFISKPVKTFNNKCMARHLVTHRRHGFSCLCLNFQHYN